MVRFVSRGSSVLALTILSMLLSACTGDVSIMLGSGASTGVLTVATSGLPAAALLTSW